jgi:hypothetical protein
MPVQTESAVRGAKRAMPPGVAIVGDSQASRSSVS